MLTGRIPLCRGFVVSILATLALTFSARAQDTDESGSEESQSLYLLSHVKVKPAMRQEWLDIQKKEVNPAFQKAGVRFRGVWETVVGDLSEYVSATPLENLAALDEPGPLRRALGPEERILLLQKISKCITSRSRRVARMRPDLSVMGEMDAPPKLGVVIRVAVLPGKRSAFETIMKRDVLPILPEGGIKAFMATQTVFGGDANEYVFLSMVPDFAELDKGPPMVRAIGLQEAGKVLEKFAGVVASVRYTVTRFNTKLSF